MSMKSQTFRKLLSSEEPLVIPRGGCPLHIKMAEAAGFEVAALSTLGMARQHLGSADALTLSAPEIAEIVRRSTDTTRLPLLVECDGIDVGSAGLQHLVRLLIAADAAAITVTATGPSAAALVAAALAARDEGDSDVTLIARIDGSDPASAALVRDLRGLRVDMIEIDGLGSVDAARALAGEFGGPVAIRTAEMDPVPSLAELTAAGSAFVTFDVATFGNVALWEHLQPVVAHGLDYQPEIRPAEGPTGSFGMFDLVGFPQVREWEDKYLSPERLEKYQQSIGLYDPGRSRQ